MQAAKTKSTASSRTFIFAFLDRELRGEVALLHQPALCLGAGGFIAYGRLKPIRAVSGASPDFSPPLLACHRSRVRRLLPATTAACPCPMAVCRSCVRSNAGSDRRTSCRRHRRSERSRHYRIAVPDPLPLLMIATGYEARLVSTTRRQREGNNRRRRQRQYVPNFLTVSAPWCATAVSVTRHLALGAPCLPLSHLKSPALGAQKPLKSGGR